MEWISNLTIQTKISYQSSTIITKNRLNLNFIEDKFPDLMQNDQPLIIEMADLPMVKEKPINQLHVYPLITDTGFL